MKYSKLMLIGIFAYIIINILGVFLKSNIKTEVVENKRIEEYISKKGLLIRDEILITSNMTGNIQLYIDEGEKIKQKNDIAYVYNDNVTKETLNNLETLENDVENIKEGNTLLLKEDIKNIDINILENENRIQQKLVDGEICINEEMSKLNSLIEDKNSLLKSDLNSKTIKNKEEEIESINNNIESNSQVVEVDKSGIVSYKYDGNESKFNIENMKDIKVEDIEDTKNNYKDVLKQESVKSGENIARIINNNKQYIAIAVNDKEKEYFEEGKDVIIKNDEIVINAKVYSINNQNDANIVLLEISEQNIEIYDTRVAEFDIIYKSIEGIKINKKCLAKEGNKQGVYVLSETNNAEFVEIKGISYENEEYIVIDYYKNKINGIKSVDIYDEIILEPKKIKNK